MKNKQANKISIKTRILVSILGLLVCIFIVVGLTFNLVVNSYIEKSSFQKLEKAKIAVNKQIKRPNLKYPPIREEKDDFEQWFEFIKVIQDKIRVAENKSEAEAIVIDENYELIFPVKMEYFLNDFTGYESVLDKVKLDKLNLNSNEIHKVSTKYGNYYLSFVKINTIANITNDIPKCYIVLLIDISSTLSLARQFNIFLIFVMCLVGIIAIFIAVALATNIAKPIKEISDFARKIGEGDFSRKDFEFKDKELDELSNIMNKSAEKLDKYDKEQKTFFQNVSHELRTPLMSIKGYAEAIKYKVTDVDLASDIILEESDRLTDLVESLLYISKIDNITKDYEEGEYDLRELLSNCTSKQKIRAINQKIDFEYDFDEKEVVLKCDEKSIYRAFSNIIENGLRYANTKIIIGCKKVENNIYVYIENDGEHISGKDLPYIFDRFYKGNKGKNGIGLSIVKSIIEKQKGEIYVQNTSIGVKFIIEFDGVSNEVN